MSPAAVDLARSLDNVSKHFLKSSKLDLPAAEIFAKWLGTPADRADIARYAVRDTELPLQLMTKLGTWENLAEMANAVNVPMDYLLVRGQQIKVFSVIMGKARQMGYVLPDNKAIGLPPGTKYEGATVLEAKRGAYFDIVTGLDYASLVSFLGLSAGATRMARTVCTDARTVLTAAWALAIVDLGTAAATGLTAGGGPCCNR